MTKLEDLKKELPLTFSRCKILEKTSQNKKIQTVKVKATGANTTTIIPFYKPISKTCIIPQ